MNKVVLSDEVRAFLHDHIESHEQLAVLLFLHAHASDAWPVEELATKLGLTLDPVVEAIGHFRRIGVIEVRHGAVAYAAGASSHARTVEMLARARHEGEAEIAEVMATHALERMRVAIARARSVEGAARKKEPRE